MFKELGGDFMRFSIFAGLLMAVSMPAAAADESAKPDKPAKAKKICKTDTTQTVSRMPKRICKTAEEWANPDNHVDPSDLRRSQAR